MPIKIPKIALTNALASTPECLLNRTSSVANTASIKLCGNSSCLAQLLFSKKYFPKTTPSSEIISVAKLFFGFSNWSKAGKSPNNPSAVSCTKPKRIINGLKIIPHNKILFFLVIVLGNY